MKKAYFISFLLIISSSSILSQSGWFWQNPLPQGNELNSIVIQNNSAFSVGANGTFIKSTNLGSNWFSPGSLSSTTLNSVSFINDLKGWACTNGAVYKTNDGGNSWQLDSVLNNVNLFSVFFLNDLTGYTIGQNGRIFKSANGGVNWVVQYSNSAIEFTNCFFVDVNTGWVIGYSGKVLKTTNGGSNWNIITTGVSSDFKSLSFRNGNTGWIGSDLGIIYRTTNGGNSWISVTISTYIASLFFINDLTGWSAGGDILKTTDGGASWNTQLGPENNLFRSIYFANAQTGIAAGVNGKIHKTTNGGINWNPILTSITSNNLREIFFINDQYGWSAGDNGDILFSSNGGNNWSNQFASNAQAFYSVRFINQNTGWIAGAGAYKTTNHGVNWNRLSISYFYSIFPVDSNNIFGCGNSGFVTRSTNGGINWINYTGLSSYFYDISFINKNTGWIGGSGQIVIKTTNGGVNWFNQRGGNLLGEISCIQFISEFIGFAATSSAVNNQILVTGNGGTTWNPLISSEFNFTTIHFMDESTGWFVTNGSIFKTTNSGINWISQSGTPYSISSIYFINNSTGWASGWNGTIVKTTTGGSVIGIQTTSGRIPVIYSLSQNYPNPFNPVTKIKFDIPTQSNSKINIYNLLGREVSTLVNEQLSPGSYEVDWDGTGFASGIYFYSLITNEFTVTKRMVLVK